MKLFLILATLAVAVHCGDKEKRILKKWAVMKAFEGCLGKDVMKMHMVEVKTAITKCKQMDAPELELPMFQSTYRTVNTLVKNAYKKDHDRNEVGFEEMMKKYMYEKFFKNMMEDEDYNMGGSRRRFRFRRDSHDDHQIALGDRLNDKLQQVKQQFLNEFGNYTCMLRECGVLTAENKFADVETLVDKYNEYPVQDQWLKEHIEDDIRMCHSIAESLPEEYLNECFLGPDIQKVKCYKKCMKYRKMKTCMNFDIKTQLESNFAPLETMVKQTKMKEQELLPLVYKILHGDMDDM